LTDFVDTDVLVRIIAGDDPAKQEAGFALFDRVISGETELCAPYTVIADAVYVLMSKNLYRMARTEVYERLSALVRIPNFHIENRRQVLNALAIFGGSNVDFGDALIAAYAQDSESSNVYSYDRDFDPFSCLTRVEP